jgi:hypothetical protein
MAEAADNRQPSSGARAPWYVPLALERRRLHLAVACGCAVALASCGGGERQDKNEPSGTFKVGVDATFPGKQKLAKTSELVVTVTNAGSRTVPNVAVTLQGLDRKVKDPTLADPSRPVFAINGEPKTIGAFPESKDSAPAGGETAYVNTWALGPLKRGQTKKFKWGVTAVKAGKYKLTYRVAAGLDGKAKAVTTAGDVPRGVFQGTVNDNPPDTRVADDGKTVVEGTR